MLLGKFPWLPGLADLRFSNCSDLITDLSTKYRMYQAIDTVTESMHAQALSRPLPSAGNGDTRLHARDERRRSNRRVLIGVPSESMNSFSIVKASRASPHSRPGQRADFAELR